MIKRAFAFMFIILSLHLGENNLQAEEVDSDVEKWTGYIEELQSLMQGKIPPPFAPVKTLAENYLKTESIILDIGCETGKNAAVLIQNGHKVVLLDVAPNALTYTVDNLQREGLDHGVVGSLNAKIENMEPDYGSFHAIVGTYAFSFIPPEIFAETMSEKIFDRIELGGYFAGGFFGEQHEWAKYADITVLTRDMLEALFAEADFKILEIVEEIEKSRTVSNNIVNFHTFHVIAQKR